MPDDKLQTLYDIALIALSNGYCPHEQLLTPCSKTSDDCFACWKAEIERRLGLCEYCAWGVDGKCHVTVEYALPYEHSWRDEKDCGRCDDYKAVRDDVVSETVARHNTAG